MILPGIHGRPGRRTLFAQIDIILLCMFLYYTFPVIKNLFSPSSFFNSRGPEKLDRSKKWTDPVLVRAFRLDPDRPETGEALKSVLESLKVLLVTFDL